MANENQLTKSELEAAVQALVAQANANMDVEQSAIDALAGVQDQIKAAVEASVALGATDEQLAPVTSVMEALDAKGKALATAIANTKGGGIPPEGGSGEPPVNPNPSPTGRGR